MFFHFTTRERQRVSPRLNLWLLRTESALVYGSPTVPLLPLFYYSLGLTQAHLALAEALSALFWLIFAIPTSWVADRFSRRVCNVVGNIIASGSFFVLANATSLRDLLVACVLLGIGNTCSQGADEALLHKCCRDLELTFAREVSFQRAISCWVSIGLVVSIGVLATYDLRIALMSAGAPYLVAAGAVYFVKEGPQRVDKTPSSTLYAAVRAALIDMRDITRYCLTHQRLRWLIFTRTVMITLTGSIGWLGTPLAIQAGLPKAFVTTGWLLFIATIGLGSWIYRYAIDRWSVSTRILLPAWIILGAMLILYFSASMWTFWLFGVLGLCRGWHFSVFTPLIQEEVPDDIRATVSSISGSLTLICYMGFVLLINWTASISTQWAFLVNCAVMLPFVLIITLRMRRIVR